MKSRLLHGAIYLLFPVFAFSQIGLNPAVDPANPGNYSQTRISQDAQATSLEGKIASEGGVTPPNTVAVLQCGTSERGRITTDRNGDFLLRLSVLQADPATSMTQGGPGTITSAEWAECEVYGEASGYSSEHLRMQGPPSTGIVQIGTIVLHPLSNLPRNGQEIYSVSATSLAAPGKAKKSFDKGEEQERKGMWAAACESFGKAVQVYPRYAIAWLELGRAQAQQRDFDAAQQSFHQATIIEPTLMEGYVQIARIAIQQQEWKELADATERIVQISPEATLNFWFLNSAANFNLGNIAIAETSVTRGLRLDGRHQLPQLEYLYGLILARRGDYNSAIFHMENYLRLSPHATDAGDAQNKVAELQKLAASATTASR